MYAVCLHAGSKHRSNGPELIQSARNIQVTNCDCVTCSCDDDCEIVRYNPSLLEAVATHLASTVFLTLSFQAKILLSQGAILEFSRPFLPRRAFLLQVRCIWQIVVGLLDLAYQVDIRLMDAVMYGVPQTRQASNSQTIDQSLNDSCDQRAHASLFGFGGTSNCCRLLEASMSISAIPR